jgi:Sel1 repeat.
LKVVTIALLAAALAATQARAFELCDTPGKLDEFNNGLQPLNNLLYAKKLEELDSKLNGMLAAHEAGRLSDAYVHRAFSRYNNTDPGWEPLLRDWVAKYPRSHAARLALGYHLTARGWGARGSGYASSTSARQFAEMERFFRQALKAYDEADALGKKPTLSIAQRIWMAPAAPMLGLDARKLYRDAIKAWPDTLQVRIRYLETSAPKWGGSVRQLESIVDDAKAMSAADQRYLQYLAYFEMGNAYRCLEVASGCGGGSEHNPENVKRAIEYFEKSIPLCPGLDGSLRQLIRYQHDQRNYPAVIDAANRMLARHPADGNALSLRGAAYGNTGRFKDAFADYDRAAKLGDADAYKDLAWFYETGTVVPKDTRKAIDMYLVADQLKVPGARAEAQRLSKAAGIPLR